MKASRRTNIDPFIVMDVMASAEAREKSGKEVLHLEVGQPGTGAPKLAREAVRKSVERDVLGYTQALGMRELRVGIAAQYTDWYGVDLSPDRVIVTTGSSSGFILAFLAALEAGDRCALAEPGYPAYRNILSALEVKPVGLQTRLANAYQPTIEELMTAHHPLPLHGCLVASPANPTGSMLTPQRLKDLVAWCAAQDIAFFSDEIYHGITFGEKAQTALAYSDDIIVINSFSKYYSMTGWRVGWIVVPEKLIRPVERLAQNLFISPPAVSQIAALAALEAGEELQSNLDVYRANRDLLLAGLPKAGLNRLAPADGAFYIYADVSQYTANAAEFCAKMLDETGIAATPGTDFDPQRGAHFIRFSFAGSESTITEAIERLQTWLPEQLKIQN